MMGIMGGTWFFMKLIPLLVTVTLVLLIIFLVKAIRKTD